MRLASRSIARSRSTGKSTFTRWTSRPGLRVFDRSRYGVMSPVHPEPHGLSGPEEHTVYPCGSSIVGRNLLRILCVQQRDQTATKPPPALFRARCVGGGLPITAGESIGCGGGRYWTRTSDLVRVKHAL